MKKIFLSLLSLLLAIITFQIYLFVDDHNLTEQKYKFQEVVLPKSIDPLLNNSNIFSHFDKLDLDKAKVKDAVFNNAILSMKINNFESIQMLNYDVYTLGKDNTSYSIITDKNGFILFADINIKKPSNTQIELLREKFKNKDELFLFDVSKYYKIDMMSDESKNLSISYEYSQLQSAYDYLNSFILNKESFNGSLQFTYSEKNDEINVYIKNKKPIKISYDELIKNISHSLFLYVE